MIDVQKVKLIIWDLDDTLWHGTLSEEDVDLPDENIAFIRGLADRGIMNSVCSKNGLQVAQAALEYAGLWEFLIFPRISWEPKGENIRLILQNTQLRAENVLFIDDNAGNLEEARFYNPGLMTLSAAELDRLQEQMTMLPVNDTAHMRLKQYKLLEARSAARACTADNAEFLRQSDITVRLLEDAPALLGRICELVQRTNQLNYTKVRNSRAELETLLNRPDVTAACVQVTDRYGDYGVVGFYALLDGKLEHFLFSCRVLGMGVEQWVYASLGYPTVTVVPEVVSPLSRDPAPAWINQKRQTAPLVRPKAVETAQKKQNILMTGGCDLMSLHYYMQDNANIDTEFDYVSPKTGLYATSMHTEFLAQALRSSPEIKERMAKEIPFYDDRTFATRFFRSKYDVVITSILNDCTRGLYADMNGGETLVFGDAMYPLETEKDWLELLDKGYQRVMNESMCKAYARRYRFTGGISPERLQENLETVRAALAPETLLIFLNAVELNVVLNGESGRHLRHIEINRALADFCSRHSENVALVDINELVHSREDLADTLRHYQRRVYFDLAQKLIDMIRRRKSTDLKFTRQYSGTPMDRLKEAAAQHRQLVIYGATAQGLRLFQELAAQNPILVDPNPRSTCATAAQVCGPDRLARLGIGTYFVLVMDRHENEAVLRSLQALGLRAFEHYVVWPNYVW